MTVDLTLISDEDINAEYWRRVRSRREVNTGGARPKLLRPCPVCGQAFGGRELRAHRTGCKGEKLKDATHRYLVKQGWFRAGENRLGSFVQFLWSHPRYSARTFTTSDAETAEYLHSTGAKQK